jgi:F-type H+-transporting ATPase subunit b
MRRGWLLVLCCLVALAVSAPVRVGAAPDHPEGGGEATPGAGAGKDEHKDEGVFSGALDLTIWTIVVFLLLLFVLSRYAWKPMLQGLEQRERNIHEAAEEARRAREEAQRLREEFQEKINRAHDEVRGILDESRRAAQRQHDDMMEAARKEIQAERDRLHREMELARDQALRQIWSQGAELAALVSAKAIRRQLTPDDHRQLVDEALAELREAGVAHQRMVASVQ